MFQSREANRQRPAMWQDCPVQAQSKAATDPRRFAFRAMPRWECTLSGASLSDLADRQQNWRCDLRVNEHMA